MPTSELQDANRTATLADPGPDFIAASGTAARTGVPARRVPGPPLPRFLQSMLWLMRPLEFVETCQRLYGDVFAVRLLMENDLVLLGRPDLIHDAVSRAGEDLRAGEANGRLLEPLLGPNSVLLLDGKPHLRQRKLLLPAFHGERMRAWEEVIREVTIREIGRWPRNRVFALRPSMQRLTIDVILRVVFGFDDGPEMGHVRDLIGKLAGMSRRPLGMVLTYGRPAGGLSPYGRFIAVRDELDRAIYRLVSQRRDAGDAQHRTDVLSTLLLAHDEAGQPMDDQEIRDELVTLLFAGHETTATSLAWCFDLLTHQPDAMHQLETDLDGGGTGYLNAVIDETFRLRPPVFIVVRNAKRPVNVDGMQVPAGRTLAPSIHLLHRNPKIYSDPEQFRPERFLNARPEPREWIPFGGGIRRCLGASFATLEMRIAIPEILRRVRLQAASSQPERYRREAVTIVPRNGTRVLIRDR
jgi:cytochrome P450